MVSDAYQEPAPLGLFDARWASATPRGLLAFGFLILCSCKDIQPIPEYHLASYCQS